MFDNVNDILLRVFTSLTTHYIHYCCKLLDPQPVLETRHLLETPACIRDLRLVEEIQYAKAFSRSASWPWSWRVMGDLPVTSAIVSKYWKETDWRTVDPEYNTALAVWDSNTYSSLITDEVDTTPGPMPRPQSRQELIRRWDSERELLCSASRSYPNSLK